MQLPDDVAQGRDVQFFASCHRAEQLACVPCFPAEQPLLVLVQVDQFDRARQSGHQKQPRIAGVIHQAELGQRSNGEQLRIGGKPRVKLEDTHLRCVVKKDSVC